MRGDLDVLCLLGMSTDELGWCRRSQVKMSKQLEVARSTIQASLNRLIAAGWVERRMVSIPGMPGERDSAHEYRVVLDPCEQQECIKEIDETGADPCRHTGTPADPPAPPADLDRHLINDLTINDTIPPAGRNGAKRTVPSVSVMSALSTVLDDTHAKAVLEHRRAMRKPLTVHAATLLAKRFALMPDPNAAADAMIGNGWQGFEPEWLENRKSRGNAPRGSPSGPQPSAFQQRQDAAKAAFDHVIRGDNHGKDSIDSRYDLDLGPGDFGNSSKARSRH